MAHKYGWVRDLPDQRDFLYSAPVANMAALPPKMDLRPECLKTVYDQGQLGSCAANAIAGTLEFDRIKQGAVRLHSVALICLLQRTSDGRHGRDGQRSADSRRNQQRR